MQEYKDNPVFSKQESVRASRDGIKSQNITPTSVPDIERSPLNKHFKHNSELPSGSKLLRCRPYWGHSSPQYYQVVPDHGKWPTQSEK